MILNVSSRCDIPAFFPEWFINRLREGYVDVRNPYYPKKVSRIILNKEVIDCIVFCTKNPIPMFKYLNYLKEYSYIFFVTITPYTKIEPNVVSKRRILSSIIDLSRAIGSKRVIVRYDPIILNDNYTIEFHEKAFNAICKILKGYVDTIIISFIDTKKNTLNNMNELNLKPITDEDVYEIAKIFGKIAKDNGINIQTCAEKYDLSEFGFINESCINNKLIKSVTKINKKYRQSKQREICRCIQTVDIGSYNCCSHFCKYCYANYDEKSVLKNMKNHDKNSSLLIGHLKSDDIVSIKKRGVN